MPHSPPSSFTSLRVGSFNVRYDGRASEPIPLPPTRPPRSDNKRFGEKPWAERRWLVADSILWSELDVVGLQEVLHNQMEDLQQLLGEKWGWVGVGRDDGRQAGEYAPIFYRKDRFKINWVDYFWLSTTPSVPGSKDWDAGQTRIVTVAHFSPLASESEGFYTLCTHWDDRGLLSRTKAAEIILDYVSKLGAEGKLVVLLGDLNSPAEEDGYRTLTQWKYTGGKEQSGATSIADPPSSLNRPFGDLNTFTGFDERQSDAKIIDFVLFLNNGAVSEGLSGGKPWTVSRYGVVPNLFDEGGLASDHRLVVAEFGRA
ncbi:Endonuclease/exonuclease/phosphatase [Leucosporidium creatinivorum]|uniref:Endonuclease/exonuclease/phosphatase n=1 Tax=Leucosporidium creatinivorum TaxID=106004 RepID=A0A1Y2G2S8_9BASI|nr:Endonuclease/exonuclease/phosphatase [Leucosporidium creatinivorum]